MIDRSLQVLLFEHDLAARGIRVHVNGRNRIVLDIVRRECFEV